MARKVNAQELPVPVVGGSTFGRYQRISSAITYNMLVSDGWFINYPGYKKAYEFIPSGGGRGQFKSTRGNFLICVVNENVYKIDIDFVVTLIGTLSTFTGEVYIDENLSFQICIVDGVNAYIYNYATASAVTVQTLNPNLTPNYVCYHNTFFLFGNITQTNTSSSWFAYAFDTATTIVEVSELALQTKPDYPLAVERIPGQSANVLVMGSTLCEVHTQVGGLQNYRRNNSISIDYGCLSVNTIATADNFIAWLAVNSENAPVILVYSGQGAVPISTDGIDYVLASLNHPERSTAMFARFDGHLVYQITFWDPTDNVTFVYDFNQKIFINASDQYLNFHPARDYSYFDGDNYFLSLNDATLYRINSDITAIDENIVDRGHPDYDDDLVFEKQTIRVTDNISQDNNERFRMTDLSLIIEQGCDPFVTGLDLAAPQYIVTETSFDPANVVIVSELGVPMIMETGSAATSANENYIFNPPYQPRVDLSMSLDGGITWSNTIGKGLNPEGYRKNILSWNRLGVANVVAFKFRFWGVSRFVVNNAVLKVS